MNSLIPLRGNQLKKSPMPPSCPVYVYDEQTPACMISQGTVRGIFLQMGGAAEDCELFFKVEVPASSSSSSPLHHHHQHDHHQLPASPPSTTTTSSGNGNHETKKTILLKPKRLRFRNGCPVSVKYTKASSSGTISNKTKVVDGIILGTCDIPQQTTNSNNGESAGNRDTFWYSVQLFDEEGDQDTDGRRSPTIVHDIKAGQLSYREPSPTQELSGSSAEQQRRRRQQEIIEIEDDDDDEKKIKREDMNFGGHNNDYVNQEAAQHHAQSSSTSVRRVPSEIKFDSSQDDAACASTATCSLLLRDEIEDHEGAADQSDDEEYHGRKHVKHTRDHSSSSRSADAFHESSSHWDDNGRNTPMGVLHHTRSSSRTLDVNVNRNREHNEGNLLKCMAPPPRNDRKRRSDDGSTSKRSRTRRRKKSPVNPSTKNNIRNRTKSDSKNGWKAIPPREGEGTTKMINGMDFHWCRKCDAGQGRWVTHTEDRHIESNRVDNKGYRVDLFQRFRNTKVYEKVTQLKSRIGVELRPHRKGTPICLSYHIVGRCQTACHFAKDHRPLKDSEAHDLHAWCKENYLQKNGQRCIPVNDKERQEHHTLKKENNYNPSIARGVLL